MSHTEQEYRKMIDDTILNSEAEDLAVKIIQNNYLFFANNQSSNLNDFLFYENVAKKIKEAYSNLTEQDFKIIAINNPGLMIAKILTGFFMDFITLKEAQLETKTTRAKNKKEKQRISEAFLETRKILEKYIKLDEEEAKQVKKETDEILGAAKALIDRHFESMGGRILKFNPKRRVGELAKKIIEDLNEAEDIILNNRQYDKKFHTSITPYMFKENGFVSCEQIKTEITTERDLKNHYQKMLLKISEEYKLPTRVITRNELLNAICDFIKTKKLIPKQ